MNKDSFKIFDKNQENLSGWFYGNIYLKNGQELSEEDYLEYFDEEAISYSTAKSILENGEETGEAIPVYCLNEYYRSVICENLLYDIIDSGEEVKDCTFFDSETGLEALDYTFDIECTLEGQEFNFFDLSDISKEHIVNGIINEGWKQGEICEINPCFEEEKIESEEDEEI